MQRRCDLIALVGLILACLGSRVAGEQPAVPVILPTPSSMRWVGGSLDLAGGLAIEADRHLEGEAKVLMAELARRWGGRVTLGAGGAGSVGVRLRLVGAEGEDPSAEAYRLVVGAEGVRITAGAPAGIHYGCQSLLQLLPEPGSPQVLPLVEVEDRPKLAWRGLMLDSGRQYQSVATVKGIIDRMAMLKLNRFHWHLTEGLGWRLEIERYPRLAAEGSEVSDAPGAQGFYTQDEVREIVAYAAARHVEVVPEIDVPGHSEAALNAYPEFGCFGVRPPTGQGFTHHILCGGKQQTRRFVRDVIDEVTSLFPSRFVHIGGDEAPKANWKKCPDCQSRIQEQGLSGVQALQIDFTNEMARHLARHGRRAICWGDVVTEPAAGLSLDRNVVVQWWNYRAHRDRALVESVRQGRSLIASTNYYTYLNFPQWRPWRGYGESRTFDFATCYRANPSDLREPSEAERKTVLGMEACLWTDYNLTEDLLDERLFPRLFALAEQMWHPGERLPFAEFHRRVFSMRPRFESLGIGGAWEKPR